MEKKMEKVYDLKLGVNDVNIIGEALKNVSLGVAYNTYNIIVQQIQEQDKPKPQEEDQK